MFWYLNMWHKVKTEKKREQERERQKQWDWQNHCLQYWTGVPLPWQPAALGWYLEQRVGITAEDLMFSTHLGSPNMALQPAIPLLAPHCNLNPLFGTQRLAPKPPAFNIPHTCQINRQLSSYWQMFCAATHNARLAVVTRACAVLV